MIFLNDIFQLFQAYKPALEKILSKKIHLSLIKGELNFLEKSKSEEYDRELVYHNVASTIDFFRDTEKLLFSIEIIKKVENIFKVLKPIEKQIIFDRYINHDYERTRGKLYKTLTFREIAKRYKIPTTTFFCTVKELNNKLKKLDF